MSSLQVKRTWPQASLFALGRSMLHNPFRKEGIQHMNRLLSTVLAVLPYLLIVGPLLVLAVGVLLVVVGAYTREWEWTGFLDKTLWDWMKLLIVPIILALGGVLITQMDRLNSARRLAADREQAQAEQSLTRQGQITDRFARAIDQLGKTDARGNRVFEVRLGGIYALEQIARDSEQDYWPIMEVLAAYVRQHAPWIPEEDQQGEEDSREATETTKVLPPAPDIQAITAVLRRRNRYFGHGEPEPLDLALTNLSRANLSGAYLSRANLSGAYLRGAYLRGAYLQGANLQQADLQGANLPEADLQEAYLQWSNLQRANLQGANLRGANLQDANLQGANLQQANLPEADLRGANLQQANLRGANLRGAYLRGANLQDANLPEADLPEADLPEANLPEANLYRADLRGANLYRADLQGANLQQADLQEAYLQQADLQQADLQGADLQGADLQGADLQGANLQGANLRGAKVTDWQLADTESLQGATMPNGQKYEDWRKDRERRKEEE
jgi:uncharacterized protein YjbI with pentapeptide repeats